jgi:dimeric dUTPase (all-alpha-NTP-PPase superfamily)
MTSCNTGGLSEFNIWLYWQESSERKIYEEYADFVHFATGMHSCNPALVN